MRRRTITLVVVGLVLALFVLPAAAQALIGDADETVEPVIEGEAWDYYTEPHVVIYGYPAPEGEEPECELDGGVIPKVVDGELVYDEFDQLVFVDEDGDDIAQLVDEDCRAVLIEGPNGQVNHGQFVSNMVHDLKDVYDKADGPFGQWVKQFAHDDQIGKGPLKVKANEDDPGAAELAELTEADDNKGPNENSKKPKKNKDK